MMYSLPPEFYELLLEIQEIDFVLLELTLYLDTHSSDVHAMEQFNQLAYESQKLKKSFESKFGPLKQYGNSYTNGNWDWNSFPWPWQI